MLESQINMITIGKPENALVLIGVSLRPRNQHPQTWQLPLPGKSVSRGYTSARTYPCFPSTGPSSSRHGSFACVVSVVSLHGV